MCVLLTALINICIMFLANRMQNECYIPYCDSKQCKLFIKKRVLYFNDFIYDFLIFVVFDLGRQYEIQKTNVFLFIEIYII